MKFSEINEERPASDYEKPYEKPKDKIEDIIDDIGIVGVIKSISSVCYEKAEHLESNWQDKESAKNWIKIAKIFDSLENKIK
jgi:hypothetical protein